MSGRQRIVRIRRDYNRWVGNQTLEDYSLRFTAKSARRWSAMGVANTALGAISFLALEAIGGAITLSFGFTNAVAAILAVGALIFATGLPIAYYAARYGVDIDLLTRGAGFGYIGSTITSLIYASFTFIFFAIEAAILATMLQTCFAIPPWIGYILCAVAVIPLVTHGITFISRFQRWTQPLWLVLQLLAFPFIAASGTGSLRAWSDFPGLAGEGGFNLALFGAAASVVVSLIAQIGEQVDFLRFLPEPRPGRSRGWWLALLAAGPGWIVIGMLKMLAGSFLATLALRAGLSAELASQPTEMYRVAFGYVLPSATGALVLAAVFVAVSQVKINITNAYAGSIAWSNFFSRLTHSHPGRVVWLVFNVAIALLLMELGIYRAIEHILSLYSLLAAAWVGALVADLVVNKPLGLSPRHIEFKRAHLYGINPVGVGAMALALAVSLLAFGGVFGVMAGLFAPFLAFAAAFAAAPAIALATGGRFYLARKPRRHWAARATLRCCICEHDFEPEDTAFCPAYAGPICSLCCSLDARCGDGCKPAGPSAAAVLAPLAARLPAPLRAAMGGLFGSYLGTLALFAGAIGAILAAIYWQTAPDLPADRSVIAGAFWQAFFILVVIAGIAAWLLVLALESRRVAQEESRRQTTLLLSEIRAHRRTDAALQRAKEAAEAANLAKSRYVVGISHELRSPLNAILGYAQLLERDPSIPPARLNGVRIIRRSGEHLAGLIEGLLDISKIEAGRIDIYRDKVRIGEFLDQLVAMFRLQAEARGIGFAFHRVGRMPEVVHTDEKRLRQILINLLSNAIKFTDAGEVTLSVRWRSEVAEFEVRDTGRGIREADLGRIFEPFQRIEAPDGPAPPGVGLGLTITKLLTEIMGGQISVVSRPGEGSCFQVKLMLSDTEAPAETRRPERLIAGYQGRRLVALVADDDAAHRSLIADLLGPLGFTLLSAPDGATCLTLAARHRPDLFLIDISMPGMSGWDLARELRRAGHAEAAIIVISANVLDLLAAPSEGDSHDDVMTKPIGIAALLEKIRQRLDIDWLEDSSGPAGTFAARALPAPAPGRPQEASPPRQSIPAQQAIRLPGRQLDELRELGTIGYVRAIHARLDEIAQEQPALASSVERLRALVAAFRMKEFMAALDAASAEPG